MQRTLNLKRTAPKLKKLYDRLNKRWFRNRLPKNTVIYWCPNLKWSGSIGMAWYTAPFRIDIAREMKNYPRLTESVLIHEMVHLALFQKFGADGVGHGKPFQKRMLKLARAGALKRLW